MNIKEQLKDWMLDHIDDNPDMFEDNLDSLTKLVKDMINESLSEQDSDSRTVYDNTELYDSSVGDDTLCLCGHTYYRHFDPYENMDPVGCKYCTYYTQGKIMHGDHYCSGFKKKEE